MRIAMMAMMVAAVAITPFAAASAQDDPVPIAKPIGNPGSWIPADSYPPAARASGEEGRVSFTLDIDANGRVNDCKVTTSSESPLLDETTCNYMTANGRFTPPRDKKNRPVPSKWSSSMRWKLEVAPPEPLAPASTAIAPGTAAPVAPSTASIGKARGPYPHGNPATWFTDSDYTTATRNSGEQGEVKVQLSIDALGQIKGCTVVKSSGSAALDLLTCESLRKRASFSPATNAAGVAIPSTYPVGTRWIKRP